MVSVSAEIDQAAVRRIEKALQTIEREAPERIAGATKRAGVYIAQSLRKRTTKAPKNMRKTEYSLEPMRGKYITRRGQSGDVAVLHRWEFSHVPTGAKKHFAAYATRKRSKTTGWKWRGLKLSTERREIIRNHDLLRIRRAGLARQSWGWVMQQINGSANAVTWKRMRGEKRDPRNFTKGLFRRIAGKGAEVEISNRLDYILAAVPSGAIGEALNAASKRLEYNINEEIRKVAAI